jgi:type I restriction enzyme, R subunit
MQRWLEPQDRRDAFYEALAAFAKTLQLALANPAWQEATPDPAKGQYTGDLKYFLNLRTAVKQRYAESVDYSVYEAQLRTIVARHVGAEEVKTLIEPVSIFAVDRFEEELETVEGDVAKADTIAARIKKTLTERMEEDPAFYKMLSELIQDAIDAHRAKRLSDADYLKRMQEQLEQARAKQTADVPAPLVTNDEARAYYGVLKDGLNERVEDADLLAEVALETEAIIKRHKVRDWQHNRDAQNRMQNEIDDLFHDLKSRTGMFVPYDVLDEVVTKLMNVAKVRDAGR